MAKITIKLTIAQALRVVKSTKGRIAELKARAASSVSHLKDVETTWDFATCREELAQAKERLVGIESAVAEANAKTRITFEDKEMTLAYAIRCLQEFKDELAWLPTLQLRSGVEKTSESEWDEDKQRNVRRTVEVTYVSALSERKRVEALDALRDRFERLNNEVEKANHRTDVNWWMDA